MDWQALSWPCSLARPPKVIHFSMYDVDHPPGHARTYRMKVWSLHLYRYAAEQIVDGVTVPIRPGYAGITPPDKKLQYRFTGPSMHGSAHFMAPVPKGAARQSLPVMQDLGDEFEGAYAELEEAVGCFANEPARARAILWHLLWRLARPHEDEPEAHAADDGAPASDMHPAIRAALAHIELHLSGQLAPADVVAHASVSHNHLNRLFDSTLGESIGAYITRRRVERARHLLVNSTIPIKAVAIEVGIPDPHLFNKTVRKVLGESPSAVRARGT